MNQFGTRTSSGPLRNGWVIYCVSHREVSGESGLPCDGKDRVGTHAWSSVVHPCQDGPVGRWLIVSGLAAFSADRCAERMHLAGRRRWHRPETGTTAGNPGRPTSSYAEVWPRPNSVRVSRMPISWSVSDASGDAVPGRTHGCNDPAGLLMLGCLRQLSKVARGGGSSRETAVCSFIA